MERTQPLEASVGVARFSWLLQLLAAGATFGASTAGEFAPVGVAYVCSIGLDPGRLRREVPRTALCVLLFVFCVFISVISLLFLLCLFFYQKTTGFLDASSVRNGRTIRIWLLIRDM